MTLSDSTKRSLRTLVQGLLALATAIPTILSNVPAGVVGLQVVAVAVAFAKAWALLEDAGVIPAWLRTPHPAVPKDSVFDLPPVAPAAPAAPVAPTAPAEAPPTPGV